MESEMRPTLRDEHASASVSSWDMPAFLEAYALHDSHLVSVEIQPQLGILVSISWDLHWNRAVPPEHAALFIRFASPYSMRWSQGAWNQSTLSGARSALVSTAEREAMLDSGEFDLRAYQGKRSDIEPPMLDATLTRTIFELMNWATLTIVHGERVQFACLNTNGAVWSVAQYQGAT